MPLRCCMRCLKDASDMHPHWLGTYQIASYSDILPLTKDIINEIFKKETTTKNIYRAIVDKHTEKYQIPSEMKRNSIRQEILT